MEENTEAVEVIENTDEDINYDVTAGDYAKAIAGGVAVSVGTGLVTVLILNGIKHAPTAARALTSKVRSWRKPAPEVLDDETAQMVLELETNEE